jgi:hypothetical protein
MSHGENNANHDSDFRPRHGEDLAPEGKGVGEIVEKVVLDLIGESSGTGGGKKKPAGESLREFAGTMTNEEAAEREEAVRIFEEIDEERYPGIRGKGCCGRRGGK